MAISLKKTRTLASVWISAPQAVFYDHHVQQSFMTTMSNTGGADHKSNFLSIAPQTMNPRP
jgi:hypothetical protein